ncbi:uncharacterized protein LOC120348904 isoform X2 [Nilaparvata lugens]|uniref:uncharacterized protein LOC120348904 isoform X2 n=1 Tax=Nilaparvata lugens TaxID=108931 RepID=UPI00193D5913|nr:uncharacterized protein LOC120348904 isoform X2 [Nilaparvata lugens]
MIKAKPILFCLFLVFMASAKSSDVVISDFDLPWNRINDCKTTCDKIYQEKSPDEAKSCSRGCRFYSMAEMIAKTTDLDKFIAREACVSSCEDSYPVDSADRAACLTGCDSMRKLKKETPEDFAITSSFSFSFFFDDGNGLKSLQSVADQDISTLDENKGTDLETDDVLTDPALKGQTGIGFLRDIKLPIIKIKTLPVEEVDETNEDNKVNSGHLRCWWLPAKGVNKFGIIPICLLFACLILMMVVLLRMMFLLRRVRSRMRARAQARANSSKPTQPLIVDEKSACYLPINSDLPDKYAQFLAADSGACAGLAKVPPPKYDEVIVIDAKMAEAAGGKPTETI